METINNVRDLLKKTLEQSIKQQQSNRDRKHELEMDWSDKLEARQRDHWCGNLKNTSPNIMFHPGASHFQVGVEKALFKEEISDTLMMKML